MARSAGTFAQLTSRDGDYAIIKLPSGETRKILATCKATVGVVGNSDHALERSGKAGRSRWPAIYFLTPLPLHQPKLRLSSGYSS